MGQFVSNDGLQLVSDKAGKSGNGQQDNRPKPSHNGGRLQPLAFAETNDAVNAQPPLQGQAQFEQPAAYRKPISPLLPFD